MNWTQGTYHSSLLSQSTEIVVFLTTYIVCGPTKCANHKLDPEVLGYDS